MFEFEKLSILIVMHSSKDRHVDFQRESLHENENSGLSFLLENPIFNLFEGT